MFTRTEDVLYGTEEELLDYFKDHLDPLGYKPIAIQIKGIKNCGSVYWIEMENGLPVGHTMIVKIFNQ